MCDGSNIQFAFGKRDIDQRDLSVSCCTGNLCNYPEVITTTSTTAATTTHQSRKYIVKLSP